MNHKYNIKSLNKKDTKEADDITKYMTEDDIQKLEDEDVVPEEK